MKKRLTTLEELKQRRVLFFTTLGHLKIYFRELVRGKQRHSIRTGGTFTHLDLAKGNFYQWIFPQY